VEDAEDAEDAEDMEDVEVVKDAEDAEDVEDAEDAEDAEDTMNPYPLNQFNGRGRGSWGHGGQTGRMRGQPTRGRHGGPGEAYYSIPVTRASFFFSLYFCVLSRPKLKKIIVSGLSCVYKH
jgi:hypothetical protein